MSTTWTANRIRSLRQSLGLQQNRFADLVGVTRIYIYYLEKGVKKPSKTLSILFDCLNSKLAQTDATTTKSFKKGGN